MPLLYVLNGVISSFELFELANEYYFYIYRRTAIHEMYGVMWYAIISILDAAYACFQFLPCAKKKEKMKKKSLPGKVELIYFMAAII